MVGGMVPVNWLYLRSSRRRFGNEEKLRFCKVPVMSRYDKLISVTLPDSSQAIPNHRQGLAAEEFELRFAGIAHELRMDWFLRPSFHFSRARTSPAVEAKVD
ncbi:unnamed protein product [Linum tenue]|uniref:Uncharacterized protein n=1 Tax=Linum tenue TaxID=586396 RepID=A0AAV0J4H5_9ROSI|nr:unnamed protein product [Linum tenue]